MSSGSLAQPIEATSLAGSYIPSGEKKRKLDEVFSGQNVRSTLDGGRFPRPGYQDTEIDLSSFGFTQARGMFAGISPQLIWIACDTGAAVWIVYCDPVLKTAYRVGTVALTTGYNVNFMEFEGQIHYANGVDAPGRIATSTLPSDVTAGATEVDLKPGTGPRFPASGTGYCEGDTFTWGGKTSDQLTTVSGILDHDSGAVVVYPTTFSPATVTTPSILAQWYFCLHVAGAPAKPRLLEFSKFAIASAPERFYDFSASTAGTEIVGEGGEITGFFKTRRYFYIFKEDSIHYIDKSEVNTTSGARPPGELDTDFGIPNQRCVCNMNGRVAFLSQTKRLIPISITATVNGQNVSTGPNVDGSFDTRILNYLQTIDDDLSDAWVFFNPYDKLLKIGVKRDGIREILVYDANLDIFYPPDTNKPFDFMCYLGTKSYALDTEGGRIYLDEVGQYDYDTAISTNWRTGRVGAPFRRSVQRYVYAHGKMTRGSTATVELLINGDSAFTKTLDDSFIKTGAVGTQVGYGGVGSVGTGAGGEAPQAYEFQFPIGVYKHGQDYQLNVTIESEDGGDFIQFDGLILGVEARGKLPQRHV